MHCVAGSTDCPGCTSHAALDTCDIVHTQPNLNYFDKSRQPVSLASALLLLTGQARLVMRQRGNFRLLLNANLWPQMLVSMMDGNKVSVLSRL